MIENTFSILSGIGPKMERRLWQAGILTWNDFLRAPALEGISRAGKDLYDEALRAASRRLGEGDSNFLGGLLRSGEHWRLFEAFRGEAVCLDIETNGFQAGLGGYTTMVGLYDGRDYRYLMRGRDLTAEGLRDALRGYKYLVTFFGTAFDIPYLRRDLAGFDLRIPHFDLCFGARKLGLGGGLKKLERVLGIERDEATRGMDGYDAVLLWQRARQGSPEAMDLLVRYNMEDTVNLMGIAETIYGGLRTSTGIEEYLN